jgi:hypothetical protein
VPVEFKEAGKFGVIRAGFKSPKWEVLPFAISQEMCHIAIVDSGLIVCSYKEAESKIFGENQIVYEFHKIPMG